ncbi:uncharacterized protein METZ01_LOCUS148713 [marine metagenome]|uniref:Uncharacterized protein n=1 Tax=marine metagenome TaxID=408172 RepID=A0A382A399_9ZZZZ
MASAPEAWEPESREENGEHPESTTPLNQAAPPEQPENNIAVDRNI